MTAYTIDPARSRAEFSVRHMMVTTVRGEIPIVTGDVSWDPDNLSSASATATLDPARILTRDVGRDEYMRGKEGLDATRFPTIQFVSTSVTRKGKKIELRGKLTVKDHTRDVVLEVIVSGNNATATGVLDRRDLGVTFGALDPAVGRELKVTVRVALVC